MRLTSHEKCLIARRAAGEYACMPKLRLLATRHRTNDSSEDIVYLEFLRLVTRRNYANDEYEILQQRVLAEIPFPFGQPTAPQVEQISSTITAREATMSNVTTATKTETTKRKYKCGVCRQLGHNARRCPQKKAETPTDANSPDDATTDDNATITETVDEQATVETVAVDA